MTEGKTPIQTVTVQTSSAHTCWMPYLTRTAWRSACPGPGLSARGYSLRPPHAPRLLQDVVVHSQLDQLSLHVLSCLPAVHGVHDFRSGSLKKKNRAGDCGDEKGLGEGAQKAGPGDSHSSPPRASGGRRKGRGGHRTWERGSHPWAVCLSAGFCSNASSHKYEAVGYAAQAQAGLLGAAPARPRHPQGSGQQLSISSLRL